ncbi:hypothetical protein [Alteromonas sp. CYL-A6]|uniref:hypothetical protein n=1 Tax=Alteromonas nitratireducens TaxID=3390813 RepID=UPI0034AC13D3
MQAVCQQQLTKTELATATIVSGISPNAMRRVFGGWILFAFVVGIIVAVAPNLSQDFINITFFVLVSFTVVIFWQSRISEGWPSIVVYEDKIGVVNDPQKREFIFAALSVFSEARPTVVKPNKKAVEVLLDTEKLSDEDIKTLNGAVWPRDDRLIGLCNFKSPEAVCQQLNAITARASQR